MSDQLTTREPAAAPVTPRPMHYIGKSLARVEDVPLLQGGAPYVGDFDRPDQLWARVVRSTSAYARLVKVDTAPAVAAGAVLAITAADIPDVRIPMRIAATARAEHALQPPLARDVVRYVGEPIAVVLAADPRLAEDLAELVEVVLDDEPACLDPSEALAPDAPVLHDALGSNEVETLRVAYGASFDELAGEADVCVSERFVVDRDAAVPLETRGLVAEHDPATGVTTIWGATKVKHFNRAALAGMFDAPTESIRMIELSVGGSFGARGEFYPEDFLIPWLARASSRPVKWIEDRAEHFVATNQSRDQVCEIEIAAKRTGALLALRATSLVNMGAYVRSQGLVLPRVTTRHLPGPYDWRAFEARATGVLTPKTPSGTFRAPGQYEAAFFRERAIDIVANRLALDPVELRRMNLIAPERMPLRWEVGEQSDIVHGTGDYRQTFERLLARSGYRRLRKEAERRRRAGEHVGIGVSAFIEEGAENQFEQARVVPMKEGRFLVESGVAAVGQGIATALTQVAAEYLSVDPALIHVNHHDTALVPEGMGAFASRAATLGGNAVAGAARDLVTKARRKAAEVFGAAEDRVRIRDGRAELDGDPSQVIALDQLGCVGTFRYERSEASVAMGANLTLVALDLATGRVEVQRHVLAFDAGRAINPRIVVGQLVGGAMQGIAGALFEKISHDSWGQPLSVSFLDYGMPTAAEAPDMDVELIESALDQAKAGDDLGVKGCGEAGVIGAGAAIANAVADALGGTATVRHLPLTPERVAILSSELRA